MNNKSYTFRPNNNLPTYYHARLRNHKNLSYRNQAIVPHEPHRLSTTMAPPGFQNQGGLSSNYQANQRKSRVNELLVAMNEMRKSNESRLTQLGNNQLTFWNAHQRIREYSSNHGDMHEKYGEQLSEHRNLHDEHGNKSSQS